MASGAARKGARDSRYPRCPAPPKEWIVSAGEEGGGNFEAERLCSPSVDEKPELGRLLDREVARPRPIQDAVDVPGRAPELMRVVGCEYKKTAVQREDMVRINRRQTVPRGKCD